MYINKKYRPSYWALKSSFGRRWMGNLFLFLLNIEERIGIDTGKGPKVDLNDYFKEG